MKLLIRIVHPALTEFYKRKKGASSSQLHPDAGVDLYFPQDTAVPCNNTTLVDLGIQCAAYTNDGKPTAFYVYPRSSISKTPLRLANNVGIIDAGYRGNIKVALDNCHQTSQLWETVMNKGKYFIHRGDRLFQICAPNLEEIHVELVETLDETARGAGGFGSTGR